MSTQKTPGETFTRRSALAGAGFVGVGLPLLAACGSDEPTTAADDPTTSSGTTPTSGSSSPSGASDALTATSDIEVGGGSIFADEKVVITQPTEGEFKGFTATCTHAGCTVSSVSDGLIRCPCHGSTYSIEDGSVQGGPAPAPLGEVELSIKGDEISLA